MKKDYTMAKADNASTTEEDLGFSQEAAPDSEATQGLQYEESEGFTFNMKDEKASSGFPVFPAGTYDAVVDASEFKISQSSGNPMWQVKWSFEVDGKTRKLTSFVVFSAEQRGRAKMFLKRIAPELAELEVFDPRTTAHLIVGKRGRVKVNIAKGQDEEDRNNIQDVLAPTGGAGGSFAL